MFEVAELGSRIGKDEYKARVPDLRQSLLKVLLHGACRARTG